MTKINDSYHAVKEHILLNGSNEQRDIILPHLDNLLAETQRLRRGILSILSDYGITELIREVPEEEMNFEQRALVRIKEMLE
tara:strand:- start:1209 stop:1454 length:246 start_codon:yes stop_codon:yes gene_type:complete